jgi:hypothetical protein
MMTRFLALVAMFFCVSLAQASITIQILPGPLDGNRVHTPWGNYVVIQEGSTVWVGTEDEYEHNRATSLFNKMGAKSFTPEGQFKDGNFFIDSGALNTNVGFVKVDGISPGIIFGAKPNKSLHRPIKPADTEYVSLLWMQDKESSISAILLDKNSNKPFYPYTCGLHSYFHVCEFLMPRGSLTKPIQAIFTAKGHPPGVVLIDSLAQQDYNQLLKKLKPVNLPPEEASSDDQDELAQLHALDESLPEMIPGVSLAPKRPANCIKEEDQRPLTRKQYNSVKIGDTMDDLDCRFGAYSGYMEFRESPEVILTWPYGKGSKANFVFDGKTKKIEDKFLGPIRYE